MGDRPHCRRWDRRRIESNPVAAPADRLRLARGSVRRRESRAGAGGRRSEDANIQVGPVQPSACGSVASTRGAGKADDKSAPCQIACSLAHKHPWDVEEERYTRVAFPILYTLEYMPLTMAGAVARSRSSGSASERGPEPEPPPAAAGQLEETSRAARAAARTRQAEVEKQGSDAAASTPTSSTTAVAASVAARPHRQPRRVVAKTTDTWAWVFPSPFIVDTRLAFEVADAPMWSALAEFADTEATYFATGYVRDEYAYGHVLVGVLTATSNRMCMEG